MINLLPIEVREDVMFARKNIHLLRWVFVLLAVIGAVFVVVIVGLVYIDRSSKSYAIQVEQAREQLKIQKLEETQTRVQEISGSIKLSVQVLSKQVLFSDLLKQIGAAMPQGTVLTGLSINSLAGGIDLTAAAKDYNAATQVQVNLQDPNNKIFEKADIINVQCSTAAPNSTNPNTGASNATQLDVEYPCKISVRALFSTNNPFLFIKNQGAKQ